MKVDFRPLVLLAATAAATAAVTAVAESLDPLQQAVVDSLATTPRITPAELLDAAVRASEVEAPDAALEWFGRFIDAVEKAGADRLELLAAAGDATDAAALARLERLLTPRQPAVGRAVAAIREAARLRRRDPARLAQAVAALREGDAAARLAAADELARSREDALAVLVPLLSSPAAADERPRRTARELVARLGPDARQPLLDWLASPDVGNWPGVFEALDASGAEDITDFLLAPALAPDVPPEVRAAAARVLEGRVPPAVAVPPGRDVAEAALAARLDQLLGIEGLPPCDQLLMEPIRDPAAAAAALGGSLTGTVERLVFDPQSRRFARVRMTPRAARARAAAHVARDLAAIDARDPRSVNLVLLARLESLLVASGDPAGIPPQDLQAALTGPNGFSPETAAEVLDEAVEHGMWEAATGVAAALAPPRDAPGPVAPLAPDVRKALVRSLAVPDAAVQFAAARTLALAGGDPPYRGSSRVVEVLAHAATSLGVDRVVIAHPDEVAAQALATGVSRFGYEPVVVGTGREAVFAARASADTMLVLLAARLGTPTALETVQFLRQQSTGDSPPVLVVIDPLDDDGRGRFLSCQIMKFSGLERVALIDRMESVFQPTVDEARGKIVAPARLPDLLAQAAGPAAVEPGAREAAALTRLARAREALTVLGRLGRRGWDVSAAERSAERAVDSAPLYEPAVRLLAVIGRPAAQEALAREAERTDLPGEAVPLARGAFAEHVTRHGMLLESREFRAIARRYNRSTGPAQDAAGAVLDVLGAAGTFPPAASPDASPPRTIR